MFAIEGKYAEPNALANDVLALRRLAVEAECDPTTARSWLLGCRVRPITHAKLMRAAGRLGLRVDRISHEGRGR